MIFACSPLKNTNSRFTS